MVQALTRKLSSADSLKLSYDFKSEGAALEWNHAPFKVGICQLITPASTSAGLDANPRPIRP